MTNSLSPVVQKISALSLEILLSNRTYCTQHTVSQLCSSMSVVTAAPDIQLYCRTVHRARPPHAQPPDTTQMFELDSNSEKAATATTRKRQQQQQESSNSHGESNNTRRNQRSCAPILLRSFWAGCTQYCTWALQNRTEHLE